MSKLKIGHRADLRALWPVNHCVPIAIGTLAGLTPEQTLRMAHEARRTPASPVAAYGISDDRTLLNANGGGLTGTPQYRAGWFRLAGLREVSSLRWTRGGPTLAQFARAHPRGRFFLLVLGFRHAVAMIDGRLFWGVERGDRRARARVNRMVEVTDA